MFLHRLALAFAAAAVIATASSCAAGTPSSSPAAANATTAQAPPSPSAPDTAAAAKAAAEQFFALYSAGQWAAAWKLLAPADRKQAPERVYEAVHQGCPSRAAGLAYNVQKITLAGSTAVVTYSISGAASALGSATMALAWTPAGWGVEPNEMGIYSHGSAAADIAAAKAAGECASG